MVFFTIDWNQVTKGWTNEAEQGSDVILSEHFFIKIKFISISMTFWRIKLLKVRIQYLQYCFKMVLDGNKTDKF